MTAGRFVRCMKCGGKMARVSPEGTSPLIVECGECGHQEGAEGQPPPPWGPAKEKPSGAKEGSTGYGILDSSAVPMSMDDGEAPFPVGWILLWLMVLGLGGILYWIVF